MINPSPLAQDFMETGRSELCPIIDIHTHAGPYKSIYFPNGAPEKMVQTMDRCGVRLIVSVSHAALVEPLRGNAFTQTMVRQFPGRILGYWGVNPHYPEQIEQDLAGFDNHAGFVGFKFLADYHRYPITGERYEPALEYANEKKLLILVHTWGHSEYDSPTMLGELAAKYPGVTLLMAHCGYGQWEESIRVTNKFDNIYLDLTGAHNANGIVERLVAGSGSHKVLFGTDLPWFDPHYVAGCVLFARISDDDRHNILHRNAERLLAPFGVKPNSQ